MNTTGEERSEMRWIRVDLHLHTPASEDYAEPNVSYLDILQEAERRGLEIIAFTDHNTVAGYEQFQRELEFLTVLEKAGRLTGEEATRLAEYRRLLDKITVLPGFEFTSHFGAHILGIFPPNRPLSLIEATLLQLGIPAEVLKNGVCSVANTRHVTEAYEIIHRAGGIVIAAHANGPNGVITETLRLGTSGQARVAVTQSPYLHALEFINFYTDHEKFTSPGFYNGKTEHYERRMFCIQGSDAHRLRRLPESDAQALHRHGIGDRYFEALLPERSFEALKALFSSQDFDRVRVPKRDQKQWSIDVARFSGNSERQILHAVHDAAAAVSLWPDIAALANIGGGVLIIGCEPGGQVIGVERPDQVTEALRQSIAEHLTPQPYLSFELMHYEGRDVIRVEVKMQDPPPYVGSNGAIYIRRDNETVVANRSEIIQLCRQAIAVGEPSALDNGETLELPRSGVEIVSSQRRGGSWVYEVRDLRTTVGVTRDRAQGLWAYAIGRHEDLREGRIDLQSQVRWRGRLGLWRAYRQGSRVKYDLVHRDQNGVIDHIFYGVSDWGLGESWMSLLQEAGARIETDTADFDQEEPLEPVPPPDIESWGERRIRWRGRGGIVRITVDNDGLPRFDLVMKDKDTGVVQEYNGVPREKLSEAWLALIRVPRPRTGIEVVNAVRAEDGDWLYTFRNLRTGDVSGAPWRLQDIEPGTVREYAARMYHQDIPLDEDKVRWWGNIGYLRPMRSQVDLVYVDEQGTTHIYYAARRDELTGEWRELLQLYGE
ncbi:putative DNA binding domain-containing protein [Chloroflexus sp. MS-CIW-1]|jgi:PHP family Zn ribbon phosphoesterase|uniref:RNA-binding domain-containing protein n=1 Tax=unclassified Chloroflexus TaxID=2633855 RepID=UPI0004DEF715|nr:MULTISPECIES: RNA-binding domain-containing protein [unclassified Chloroflexus]MBO9346765.1 putative DNA binding domain-containing protein [Chloroflexus sp.]MDN5270856.1 putative DNA binding domain-containing protein [Chloroflexus sp. MS-CIW-1]